MNESGIFEKTAVEKKKDTGGGGCRTCATKMLPEKEFHALKMGRKSQSGQHRQRGERAFRKCHNNEKGSALTKKKFLRKTFRQKRRS